MTIIRFSKKELKHMWTVKYGTVNGKMNGIPVTFQIVEFTKYCNPGMRFLRWGKNQNNPTDESRIIVGIEYCKDESFRVYAEDIKVGIEVPRFIINF